MTPHHLNRLNILPDKYLMSNKPSKLTDSILKLVHSRNSKKLHEMEKALDYDNFEDILTNYVTIDGKAFPKLSRLNSMASEDDAYNVKLSREINDFDLSLLLKMALTKIPQIPFQFLMDAFRWNLFNGTISMNDANAFYWNTALQEQGIHPPDWIDRRDYFDLGAKFHLADNTPYTRFCTIQYYIFINKFLLQNTMILCFVDIFWQVLFRHKSLKDFAK